jgi:regulator of sigma D
MLKRSTDAIAKWKGFDNAIDRWLDERHQLIVKLSEFASDRDLSGNGSPARIQDFLSLLIDYVSAGHFEFYQRLLEEGTEFEDTAAVAAAEKLLKTIDQSTQSALDFNEKYDAAAPLNSFADDLSELAEGLVQRFAAEDQMISTLHRAHLAQHGG